MALLLERLNSSGTLTKLQLNGVIVYYSYSTPVAIECKEFTGATEKTYSKTTSKQIAQLGFKENKINHEEFKKLLQKYNII